MIGKIKPKCMGSKIDMLKLKDLLKNSKKYDYIMIRSVVF